jgi:CRP-like cAMP-binding protein
MQNLARSPCNLYELTVPAKAGEVLFHEGDPCGHVFEVRRGVVRGVNVSYEGDRQVSAFFFPGDQIGIPVAEHYRFTAEAVCDLAYVRHSRAQWQGALIRNIQDNLTLLPSINSEQDSIIRRSLIVGRSGIMARLGAFLMLIDDRLPIDADGSQWFPLPQTDIAAYLAMSPESVCRAFRQLRDMGVIDMPARDRIIFLDRGQLSTFAGSDCRSGARDPGPAPHGGSRRRLAAGKDDRQPEFEPFAALAS